MLFSFIKKLTDAFYFYLMMSLMMMIFGKFKLNETHAHTHACILNVHTVIFRQSITDFPYDRRGTTVLYAFLGHSVLARVQRKLLKNKYKQTIAEMMFF